MKNLIEAIAIAILTMGLWLLACFITISAGMLAFDVHIVLGVLYVAVAVCNVYVIYDNMRNNDEEV